MEVRVIADLEAAIVAALNEVRRRFDYVFTTGGIGPTHDDITAECIAKAFGLPLVVHPEARAILEAHYEPGQLTEARLRMARTPQGAVLIDNPVSKRSEEHTSELQSLMRISYAVFCLKKKNEKTHDTPSMRH